MARIGTTILPPAGRPCTFEVPQDARGEQLVFTITVEYRGDESTLIFPMKVT
jgi:hypothetical protein